MKIAAPLGLCLFVLANPAAKAVDGFGLLAASSSESDADLTRVDITWKWDKTWFEAGNWHLTGYWEASLGHWNGKKRGARTLWDVGITPVFRLEPKAREGIRPYLEGAVGIHLLSSTKPNDFRDLTTAFQFGDHVGVGITFGDRQQFDLGLRIQHLSNASVKDPNWGIDFHQVRFSYAL